MKKLSSFLVAFILVITALFSFGFSGKSALSASAATTATAEEFQSYAMSILMEYKGYTERLAGSKQEEQAASYIATKLGESGLVPKNNDFVKDGVQNFKFMSVFSQNYENSQNIVYDYVGDPSSKEMIIIGCHYDSVAFGYTSEGRGIVASESIAGSASSVAMVLALANYLPKMALKFNIEFVFFGAGESDHAGSKFFTQSIGDEKSPIPKDSILLMVNFDSIGVGKNVYYYVDEVADSFSDELASFSADVGVHGFNPMHVAKQLLDTPNELGLKYSHVGMESENFNFMSKRIKSLNIFAGDYESGLTLGRSEFGDNRLVLYTENDNLEFITKTYGENCIANNWTAAYAFLTHEFSSENFLQVLRSSAGSSAWYYSVFANQNMVLYLTVFAFVVMIVIAMAIHYRLTVKSYYSNVEVEFLHSVIKICENVGSDEEFNDEIPTEVSRKIADDIKKDKTIKQKRKNNDEQ